MGGKEVVVAVVEAKAAFTEWKRIFMRKGKEVGEGGVSKTGRRGQDGLTVPMQKKRRRAS